MGTFKIMISFSKVFIPVVALAYFVLPSIAHADETVTSPTLPITEEANPVMQSEPPTMAVEGSNTDANESTNDVETTSTSENQETDAGLLGENLNNATERGVLTDTQGLTVKTGIDKSAIIAGAIATFIGFSIFAMVGILRKINYNNDGEQEK